MKAAPVSGGSIGSVGGSIGSLRGDNPSMMMPLRSESMAYPSTPGANLLSRAQLFTRQHAQKVVFTMAFVVFVLFISSDYVHNEGLGPGGLRKIKNG